MILDTIVERKKVEVQELLSSGWQGPGVEVDGPRGFRRALLADDGVAIIAEAKKASPSKGVLAADFDPLKIGMDYQEGGASAMSILTDESFFQGSLSYIPRVRAEVGLPVLRKDFIIHECQIRQALEYGADAILLIVAILDDLQIRDFYQMAIELGMDVLTEVHSEAEAERALKCGCNLIGINNRNLKDFSMDLQTTFRVKGMLPDDIPVVSESGIRERSDIVRLEEHGVDAALIGETLMCADDRVGGLRDLLGRG